MVPVLIGGSSKRLPYRNPFVPPTKTNNLKSFVFGRFMNRPYITNPIVSTNGKADARASAF